MALGFYFAPTEMNAQRYDECIKQLKKAGAHNPPGRVYHAAFGTSDKIMVFDVWTSQAAFDKFGQTLMPILTGLGVDPGQPMVSPIHNVIIPPAKKAAARKAPAKRGKARKGKKR